MQTVDVILEDITLRVGPAVMENPKLLPSEEGETRTIGLHLVLWTADENGQHYLYDACGNETEITRDI